jgi:hypothetical protein
MLLRAGLTLASQLLSCVPVFHRGLGSGMHSVAVRHHVVIVSRDSDMQMSVAAELGGQCC